MKIIVDNKACAGHARCNEVAPGLYELDDNGYISTAGFDVEVGQQALARRGARACPERVIHVVDDSETPPGNGPNKGQEH
ncbi:MAG TPA: ferredoxin [Pseudomonas xinjiangensis]|uniref:Ferredoxin n=2 Tax=root TaxID=1 RepID=A0A7V1BNP1_9GAMM|nr:ferredoxin [Halopseudomonas xinjiangensis]HEC49428.1 ferredoxin [Halopseudomonas xinjiangensis]